MSYKINNYTDTEYIVLLLTGQPASKEQKKGAWVVEPQETDRAKIKKTIELVKSGQISNKDAVDYIARFCEDFSHQAYRKIDGHDQDLMAGYCAIIDGPAPFTRLLAKALEGLSILPANEVNAKQFMRKCR